MQYKVGIGYDIHRLSEGRKLILGGVEIPHKTGLDGHSDADVLLHSLCDSILGALGKGDIGELFPNTDDKFKGISSLKLLKEVREILHKDGFNISNIDCVVQAEEPKLLPFKKKMAGNIARTLGVEERYVNIKATTMEGLGAIGEKKGIAAYSSVIIFK
ncbi:MAG: 2-C-methyl-D-erythritol 2,4-cyclodiphosphate synthase [Candidatus Omnitrophica bacterium]|nr:2-C-methyl-D-erythritol 2,4-cyclodiphosphate synthase [Candidatus Omnitrophota bacterium]